MKQEHRRRAFYFMLIISLLFSTGCSDRAETISCFPNSPVSVQLNLNLPAYYPLQSTGGWMYINEQSAGTRGLIVVRTASGFNIYDRNAPHLCPDGQTTLEVVNNIKITCPKDGAEWILLTGQPTAVVPVAPKIYPYQYDAAGNTLFIHN